MKKNNIFFLILSAVISFSLFAQESWKASSHSYTIYSVEKLGFVNEKCRDEKKCSLIQDVIKLQSKDIKLSPVGGQDPASLLCKEMKGEILFIRNEQKDFEDAFCIRDKEIVSLSLIHYYFRKKN